MHMTTQYKNVISAPYPDVTDSLNTLTSMLKDPDPDQPIQPLSNTRKSYPAILHAAVLSALILPVGFIPYIAVRRHINGLRKTLALVEKNVSLLRTDVDAAIARQAMTSSQLGRIHNMASNAFDHSRDLKAKIEQQDIRRVTEDDALQTGLVELTDEIQHLRSETITALRASGTSLADIAAFMQEIELTFGLDKGHDKRGIERIRALAIRLEELSNSKANNIPKQNHIN